MHLRGWCDHLSLLFGITDQGAYMRCKRALGRLLPPSPRGHGRDLAPPEAVRALVIGFIPARGGEWLAQAERLLGAREFAADPSGGWIATGSPETFETRMTTLLTGDSLGDVSEVWITGVVPWAEIVSKKGDSTLFAPSRDYRKGRRLILGLSAAQATVLSRSALESIAEWLRSEQTL
jgi:hypothetical protein